MSRFAAGVSRRRNAALAVMVVGFTAALGTASANATEQDEKYLAGLNQAEIPYESPGQAIQLGKGVCGTFQSLLAQGLSYADIRGRTIAELKATGLNGMQAMQLMGIGVANYCPQYFDVAGD